MLDREARQRHVEPDDECRRMRFESRLSRIELDRPVLHRRACPGFDLQSDRSGRFFVIDEKIHAVVVGQGRER